MSEQNSEMFDTNVCLDKSTLNTIYIAQREINKSHKTLGTIKSIAGNKDNHIKFLIEKSNNYAQLTISRK
jgi:hypothetical protein